MPKISQFLNKTSVNNSWQRLVKYLEVNGEKLDYDPSELLNKQVSDRDMTTYGLGIIFDKYKDYIEIASYTVLDKKCVINHQSNHKLDKKYSLISGRVNMFDNGYSEFDNDDWDGALYVNNIMDELTECCKKGRFRWDEILY